ncbi:MAG: stage IV sporulation protein FB [Verrucomicrobia bacterium]|nr:stage IV sporulation protein FB [Verrucomicrobiota bacterium]
MLIIPGRIPVAIHPFFWVLAAFIGWLYGQSILGMLIWIGIIFVSVLFHEYGHALTAVAFKQKARIQLVALGGLTSYDGGPPLKFWQQFLIVFNGPLFGFILCLLATLALQFQLPPLMYGIFKATQVANFFWSVVNLFPVIPLDGGQLLRIVLEGFFGVKGFKASLITGAILSGTIACAAFVVGYFIAGAFFFLFAFQSFDAWRKCRHAIGQDRDEYIKNLMLRAESALQSGQHDEARLLFEEIRAKGSGGMLAFAAAQYLAFLDMKDGKKEEAYQLLLPIKDQLAEESICLLHQLASEHANDSVVTELSARCYQFAPSQEVALRNARSFARMKMAKPAGGWLQTAWQHGPFNIEKVISESSFTEVKNDPTFQEFIQPFKD